MIARLIAFLRGLFGRKAVVTSYAPTILPPAEPKRLGAYAPAPGYDWNPLRAYRNVACPCGSNLKVKRCHGKLDLLPVSEVAAAKEYLRRLSMAGVITARPKEIA